MGGEGDLGGGSGQTAAPEKPPSTPDEPDLIPIGGGLVLIDPPALVVLGRLPCDLAHRIVLEVEGRKGETPAGSVVLSSESTERSIPLVARGVSVAPLIGEPGNYRVRAILRPDPHLGWADPAIRSVWSGPITTNWAEVRVIRA